MTRLQEKTEEAAVTTVKPVKPPEGFLSLGEFAEQNPNFCDKYDGNRESHMAIWLDEPTALTIRVSRKYETTEMVRVEKDGEASYVEETVERSRIEDVIIKSRSSETLRVWEFITWFGDPSLKLHLEKYAGASVDNKVWSFVRKEKLRLFGRDLSQKPGADGAPMITSPPKSIADMNTAYFLWDKFPNIYILLPDKMVMSIGGEDHQVDPIEITWEVMYEQGIDVKAPLFKEEEIRAVHDALFARAKELKIESIFSSSAAGTIVCGYMIAAQEKYAEKGGAGK